MPNTPEPPAHLRAPTAEWGRSVLTDYELKDHHVRLLHLACEGIEPDLPRLTKPFRRDELVASLAGLADGEGP